LPRNDLRDTSIRYIVVVIMSKSALEFAILGSLKERSLHGYELRKELKGRLGLFPNLSFGTLYPALKRMERDGLIERHQEPKGWLDPGSRAESKKDRSLRSGTPLSAPLSLPGSGSSLTAPSGSPGKAAGAFVPLTGSLSGERAAASSGFSALEAIPRHARTVYSLTPAGEQRFAKLLQSPDLEEDDQMFKLKLAFASHLPGGQRMELLIKRRESLRRALSELEATGQRQGTRLDRYSRALRQHRLATISMEIQWTQELIDNEKEEETSWARSV